MKILVDLHGFTRTFELDHWQENTTLSDLILAAGGPYIAPDDPLYLDSQPLQGASQLGSVALLEGSVISQRPLPMARPIRGWNLTLAGGTRAGAIVPLSKGRPLIVGRSPQADIVLPTESASWEHCRIERTEEGVKITDARLHQWNLRQRYKSTRRRHRNRRIRGYLHWWCCAFATAPTG